jgi:hypothetical protein
MDPKRWPNARIMALLCGAVLVAILDGCGSGAPPRAIEQTPVVSQYKGWSVSVAPSVIYGSPNIWRARVRVWPPEVRPETHPGISLSFNGSAADRGAIEQAATAAARRYIDASISVH